VKALLLIFVLAFPLVASAEPEKDIFGRSVPEGRGQVVLVLYANRQTQDACDDPMNDLTFNLRDIDILVLIRIDLRGIPSIFEGIAKRIMRSAYVDGLEKYRKKFRDAKLEPPKDDDKGLFFIADSYGKPHQAAGLASGFKEAMMVAYDPAGREIARMKFPQQLSEIEAAIRKAVAKPATK